MSSDAVNKDWFYRHVRWLSFTRRIEQKRSLSDQGIQEWIVRGGSDSRSGLALDIASE
jgi:hypothetical protein